MARVTAYEFLRVDESANEEELQSAYRRRAFELHPDRNQHPQAEEQFKNLQRAWSFVKTAAARAAYDQKLAAAGLLKRAPVQQTPLHGYYSSTTATTWPGFGGFAFYYTTE